MIEAADALELMAGEVSQIDAAFQFWLASTFAVIVAAHSIRETMTNRLKATITLLYVLLAIYSLTKSLGDFHQLMYLADFAATQGYELPTELNSIAGVIRFLLYFVGTIAAVIFVWSPGSNKGDAT